MRLCVCVYRQLVQSTRTALSNWNAKARWASVCVHWYAHRHCTTQLPSSPTPPPLQMTSILSEQLCTLADGCLLMYSVADRDRYLLHQQLMGAGSGCTVTNSVQQDIPSVPVECAVCFAHPVTHLCAHASLASTSGLLDQHKVWLARPPQQVWLARPSQHKSGLLDHLSTSLAC